MASDRHDIALSVNGAAYRHSADSRMLLSDFLRHELRLAGTHVGCEHGVCGACTILLDGVAIRSYLMLSVQANGCELSTIEGLATSQLVLKGLNQVAGAIEDRVVHNSCRDMQDIGNRAEQLQGPTPQGPVSWLTRVGKTEATPRL